MKALGAFNDGFIWRLEMMPTTSPWQRATVQVLSLDDDVVFGSIREFGDVLSAIFRDNENVVFAITAAAFHVIRDCDHGLHGNHHAGLKHCLDVLTKLQF